MICARETHCPNSGGVCVGVHSTRAPFHDTQTLRIRCAATQRAGVPHQKQNQPIMMVDDDDPDDGGRGG